MKPPIESPSFEVQRFSPYSHEDYTYQYSASTGNRRALLIGIDDLGQYDALIRRVSDVKIFAYFLEQSLGFKKENITILTNDPESLPELQPTRANILRAMKRLVKDAKRNDSLVFFYAGKLSVPSTKLSS